MNKQYIITTLDQTATEATSWIKYIVVQGSAIVKYCLAKVMII